MKQLHSIFLGIFCMFPMMANAVVNPLPPTIRPSIFSTSSDWEAVTGIRLGQYNVNFIHDSKLIGNGMELYYLDGFPCYGQPDRVQIWLGPNGKSDRDMLITCLFPPQTINLALRHSKRDVTQDTTTGLLICPVTGTYNLTIDLSKCALGKEWKEYR